MADDTLEGASVTPIGKARQRAVKAPRQPKAPPHHGDWRDSLSYNKNGDIRSSIGNITKILMNSPEWAGVIAGNDFAGGREMLTRAPPFPPEVCPSANLPVPGAFWLDTDDVLAAAWLEKTWQGMTATPEQMAWAVRTLARQNPIHPVRDYLDSLAWDGVRRLPTWLSRYLGVETSEYVQAVGPWWMVSAIARVRSPGCRADHCLVLEGPQGRKKSTALATLAGEWFSDQVPELGSKDSYIGLSGRWIIELAELDATSRAENSRVKAFLTATTDRYRPVFGRRNIEVPRQCVFAGTVNHDEWNKDPTGARRFWPVRVGSIDIEALKRDRDQLWAEADQAYLGGMAWWPTNDDEESTRLSLAIQEEQSSRYEHDAWEQQIAQWLETRVSAFTLGDVMVGALQMHDKGKWSRSDQNRVGYCLRRLECITSRPMINGQRTRQWTKKT